MAGFLKTIYFLDTLLYNYSMSACLHSKCWDRKTLGHQTCVPPEILGIKFKFLKGMLYTIYLFYPMYQLQGLNTIYRLLLKDVMLNENNKTYLS